MQHIYQQQKQVSEQANRTEKINNIIVTSLRVALAIIVWSANYLLQYVLRLVFFIAPNDDDDDDVDETPNDWVCNGCT